MAKCWGCISPCGGPWVEVSGTPSHLHLEAWLRQGWGRRRGVLTTLVPSSSERCCWRSNQRVCNNKARRDAGDRGHLCEGGFQDHHSDTQAPRATKELQPLHPTVPEALESPSGWELPGPELSPPSRHGAGSERSREARLEDQPQEVAQIPSGRGL